MTTRRWGWVALGVWMGLGLSAAAWSQGLGLDTFNKGEKPNALGGDFGSWNIDPKDDTQFCRDSFNAANAYGGSGYALRLDYDVDSPNPAYNGFWSKLQQVDLRPYRQLSFYIKGDALRGYPAQMKLELKNKREIGRYTVQGLSDQWQHVTVPLEAFIGVSDWSRMTEFVVVFDDLTTTPKVGTVYLDELVFE